MAWWHLNALIWAFAVSSRARELNQRQNEFRKIFYLISVKTNSLKRWKQKQQNNDRRTSSLHSLLVMWKLWNWRFLKWIERLLCWKYADSDVAELFPAWNYSCFNFPAKHFVKHLVFTFFCRFISMHPKKQTTGESPELWELEKHLLVSIRLFLF